MTTVALRLGHAAAVLGLVAGAVGPARADLFILDQQQTANSSGGGAINPPWSSIGQSFTPTLSSVQWAEFTLRAESAPVDLHLAIRDGLSGSNGLAGPLLGSSAGVTLANTSFAPVRFQLPSAVALTPGHTYVAQVVVDSSNAGFQFKESFGNPYSAGQMLQAPYPASLFAANGEDFTFSEGAKLQQVGDRIVDQQQAANGSGGGGINPPWSSIGQSFTPSLSSIDWAEFTLRAESAPVVFHLAIRDGLSGDNGLAGTVVGVSPEVTVSNTNFAPVLFELPSVALTPGHTYVAEVVADTLNTGFQFKESFGNPYSAGQMLQAPYPASLFARNGEDFTFREGVTAVTAVPEPATSALFGSGALIVLGHVWWRRRRAGMRDNALGSATKWSALSS